MKVKATQMGFFGNKIRNIDEEFEVPTGAFSKVWMKSLKKPKAKTVVEPSIAPTYSAE